MERQTVDLPQFSGLRGIAALLVLFFHLRTPQGLELHFGVVDAFSKFGFLGVDVFFVLSGFILCHVYGTSFSGGIERKNLRNFGVARFARIYPLHLVTTLMMLGAYWAAMRAGVTPTETSGYSWESFLLSLLLVHEWFGVVAPNPGSWSISVEFASYLIFPFIVGYVLRVPRLWPLALIAVGAIAVDTLEGTRVLRSVTEFVMGCSAYAAARHIDTRRVSMFAGLTFILPFIAADIAGHELAGLTALSFAVTVLLLSRPASWEPFARLCASRPLVFLGDISYSVYLLQWFIWIGWKHELARLPFFAAHPYLMILGAAMSVVLCATASYFIFEHWARRRLRGLLMVGKTPVRIVTIGAESAKTE